MALISNTAPTSIANIQEQFDRISCPLPAGSGLWNSSGILIYDNGTYNYPDVNTQTITFTCTQVHTLDGVDYYFGQPTVAIGVLFYALDYTSEIITNKAGAFLTIVFYILTPANFNILGFTIDDISGFALMFIIILYSVCYIAIGAMMYKIISPFSGVGG